MLAVCLPAASAQPPLHRQHGLLQTLRLDGRALAKLVPLRGEPSGGGHVKRLEVAQPQVTVPLLGGLPLRRWPQRARHGDANALRVARLHAGRGSRLA